MKSPLSTLITSVVVLALALAGYAALRAKVARQSAAVAALAYQIEAKTAAAGHLARVRETLASLTDEEAVVQQYFVPDTAIVLFIEELQSRGRVLGADIEIASVAAIPASAKSRSRLAIALSIAGPFDAVMRTLGSIEYAPYAIRVTSLSLSLGADAVWTANASLSAGAASTVVP
ncbi:MAG TPA: hypothetical protein VJK73_01230 [Candidatus Paceibacterota bacterium]|uniref:Uncharacterized protein n=1 Tax=Candidatus Kaiserbacteria bacterium RIFCSPHIGHO2_01_FULL_54_36b TaxID=1798483 RepID=A0A1F6CJY3_9BACT|nr:MAG: hypothetical protein A2704_01935 [Candidatus Kaiserbacteria bacterium RIFCSPHIGHO2_01_FULL_54_36b]